MTQKMESILERFIDGLTLPPFQVNTNHFRDNMLRFAAEVEKAGMPFSDFKKEFTQRLFEELYAFCPNDSQQIGILMPKCLSKIKYYVDILSLD